jgi:predicted glycosyltransferase
VSRERSAVPRESEAPRFLFYSHDGLGLGHIPLNLAIARALTDTTARPSIVGVVDALVCIGGYNTLTQAISRCTSTVCIPRVSPRREQLIRAEAFGRLGRMRTLRPDSLSAVRRRAEIELALTGRRDERARRGHMLPDFGGARRAARSRLELAHASAHRRCEGG